MSGQASSRLTMKEVVFQVILHVVVFIFYTHDRHNPEIETSEVLFFLSYAVAAGIINYVLLPRFLYRSRFLQFAIGLVLVIAAVMAFEELVLEQIYFPDTRGQRFPGVFLGLLNAMPTITILSGFKFAWDAISRQREVEKLEHSVKESELQFLRSQINPHFLFNNLNNLYSFAIENSPRTPEIILELSGVLRYMLYDCQAPLVPLKKEVEQLDNYIRLSRLHIEGRGDVTFSKEIAKGNFQIAPLILTVFVENAFKHSACSQTKDILIDIELEVNQHGQLRFICRNSFLDESNTTSLSKGIGLVNVQKRLELVYPSAHELKIKAMDDVFSVELVIDLNREA